MGVKCELPHRTTSSLTPRILQIAHFLDVQAEVDHDDAESGDETDGTDQCKWLPTSHRFPFHSSWCFIGVDVVGDDYDDLADNRGVGLQVYCNRELHHQSIEQECDDLQRIADHFNSVYRRPSRDLISVGEATQQTISTFQSISECTNARLWKVPVKVGILLLCCTTDVSFSLQYGTEAKLLSFLRRRSEYANRNGATWIIGAAFSCPSIPGVIYVTCEDPDEIRRVFQQRLGNAIGTTRTITLVPPDEHLQLLKMPIVCNPIAKGNWVRIKKGAYNGDIGYVTLAQGDQLQVLVVPRVSYQRRQDSPSNRPCRSLFDADLARAVFGSEKVAQSGGGVFLFEGQRFKNGLLEVKYHRQALGFGGVRPTLEEIELFSDSPGWDWRARARWNAEEEEAALRMDDRVQITKGEFKGYLGIITHRDNDTVNVHLFSENNKSFGDHLLLQFPSAHVRKYFKIGDYIHVRLGIHAGKCGYVVNVTTGDTLEFVEWDKSVPNILVRWKFAPRACFDRD